MPDASDDVCIDRPGAEVWVWLDDPFEANTLVSTEDITLPTETSSLTLHGPSVVDDAFGVTGTIIANDLTFNGNPISSGGDWVGNFVNNGTFEILNGEGTLDGTLVNEAGAMVQHWGTGSLTLASGAEVVNHGLWNIVTAGDLLTSGGVFTNPGVIQKGGTGTSTFDPGLLDTPGTIQVNGGTLNVDAAVAQVVGGTLVGGTWVVTGDGSLALGAHGILSVNETDVTLDGPAAMWSGMTLAANGGTLRLRNGGLLSLPADFANSGVLRLGPASKLVVSGDFSNVGAVFVEIADEPITGLFGGIAVGGEAVLGGTLDIDLVGGFTPVVGDEFEVMQWSSYIGAFSHIVDMAPHFTPDYRPDAFVLVVEESPPPVDVVDFSALAVTSYESNQDAGTAEVLDGGATLRLAGNAWKKVSLPTTVEADTILAFDFSSSSQGEIQGIGFDTDNGMSPDRTFQVFGTQTWGIQDFHSYVAPGVVRYEI
ncbi:MAG: hypothetical protein GY926_23835, partial [bacterium]|nr:hypothetical protein [bacterium]